MFIVNMVSSCTHKEASFVSFDHLDNISILLNKHNDLEKEVTHLFHEVFLFSTLKKKQKKYTTNQALNILKA